MRPSDYVGQASRRYRRQGRPTRKQVSAVPGVKKRTPMRPTAQRKTANCQPKSVDRGEKMLPIADVMRVSNEVSDRQFPGRSRFLLQLKTHLFR